MPGLVHRRGEDPLVGDRAGVQVVIVGVDLLAVGIGVIEGLVVGAPARPVVADDAALQLVHAEVGVEPEEAADGRFGNLVLAAGEEAAAPVHLAVVEERARLVGVDQGDELGLAAREIHEVEAVAHGHHPAPLLAERKRAHRLRQRPGAGPAAAGVEAPDLAVQHVDPVEDAVHRVPDRPFAEIVVCLHDAFDPDHRGLPLPSEHSPRAPAGGRGAGTGQLYARAWPSHTRPRDARGAQVARDARGAQVARDARGAQVARDARGAQVARDARGAQVARDARGGAGRAGRARGRTMRGRRRSGWPQSRPGPGPSKTDPRSRTSQARRRHGHGRV